MGIIRVDRYIRLWRFARPHLLKRFGVRCNSAMGHQFRPITVSEGVLAGIRLQPLVNTGSLWTVLHTHGLKDKNPRTRVTTNRKTTSIFLSETKSELQPFSDFYSFLFIFVYLNLKMGCFESPEQTNHSRRDVEKCVTKGKHL